MIDYILIVVLLISMSLDSYILRLNRKQRQEQSNLNDLLVSRSKDMRERDMLVNRRIDGEIDRTNDMIRQLQQENLQLGNIIEGMQHRLEEMDVTLQNLQNQLNNV
jgi:hypothetical protein